MYEREIAELTSILNSKLFLNLLNEHKKHWQETANENIRQQKLIEAYGAISRYDDIDKIVGLIKKRITDLTKGETKNG